MTDNEHAVRDYIRMKAEELRKTHHIRTGKTYLTALSSLTKFLGNEKLSFMEMTQDLIERYETWLQQNSLCRNTSSYYMRILRSNYNQAVAEGIVEQCHPFRNVYTGIDKTPKRALTLSELRRIKRLDLSHAPSLAYARDLFLLSFYMRGIAFIDLAYLRKQDLHNGYLIYSRKKTRQQLCVRWEKAMQEIVARYANDNTCYMLSIIEREDGTEHRQYITKLGFVNRKLKRIAKMLRLSTPLTMHVARHSWASIAQREHLPVSVISEALGHSSEATTRIYLSSIRNTQIDDANRKLIRKL